MMRIVHATDVHWYSRPHLGEIRGKRILGTANLFLRGRRHEFTDAAQRALIDHIVSLAGFGLRSRGSDITNPEGHLDLIGHLAPGESKTFLGGEPNGWQFEGDTTFNDGAEYARLVWNEIELSYAPCFGTVTNTPASLPLKRDAEGEIWIDTVVEFGAVDQVPLSAGWNLLAHGGDPVNVGEAFHGHEGQVGAVYAWDSATGRWERHLMTAPAYANSFNQFEPGVVYWVEVKEPFTLYLGK